MLLLFDSHAHYDDPAFDADREELLLKKLPEAGVARVVNIGHDRESSFNGIFLAERHPFMNCAVGYHPHAAGDLDEHALEELRLLSLHPKTAAIGEIGLDYADGFPAREVQKKAFIRQLLLAKECALPVVIHSRFATGDTMAVLKKYKPQGVMHCFTGSAETAREILSLGMYIGFTGAVTFKNAKKVIAAVAETPLDHLLIETDAPSMTPEPFRGERCDSGLLHLTAERIAAIKGCTPEEVAAASFQNALRFYRLEA